jgi:hypothetical protein
MNNLVNNKNEKHEYKSMEQLAFWFDLSLGRPSHFHYIWKLWRAGQHPKLDVFLCRLLEKNNNRSTMHGE